MSAVIAQQNEGKGLTREEKYLAIRDLSAITTSAVSLLCTGSRSSKLGPTVEDLDEVSLSSAWSCSTCSEMSVDETDRGVVDDESKEYRALPKMKSRQIEV